jgi:hypothetical protein
MLDTNQKILASDGVLHDMPEDNDVYPIVDLRDVAVRNDLPVMVNRSHGTAS